MLAVNDAVVALAGTLIEAGKVNILAIAPERVMEAPAAGAAWAKVMVQVVLELEASVDAAHCTEPSDVGMASEKLAVLEEPPKEAVMVAL